MCVPAILAAAVVCAAERSTGAASRKAGGDEKIARFRQAVAKRPSADNHAALAWVLSRYKSASDEAMQHVASALELEPRHYKAHEIAAIILEMRGLDGELLPHLLAMMTEDRPETEIYIRKIGQLGLSVPQRRTAISTLERFVAEPGRCVDRTVARRVLGGLLLREGRLDEARAMFDALGLLATWRIIGPFDNEANAGFGMTYGPETEIDLAKTYIGRGTRVGWRKLEHRSLTGLCDLAAVMYPNDQALAYAVTYVKAPAQTQAVVRMGAEQSVKVWVNDRLILQDDQNKGYAFDQHVAPVVLAQGWNKILVKICRSGGKWRFGLRLTAPSGAPLDGLTVSSEPKPTPDGTKSPSAKFDYGPGALAHFDREVARNRQNESSVYYLGMCQLAARRRAPAAQTFEWLVTLNRHCSEYRIRMATAYWVDEKPDKAFEQLKAVLSGEPKNPMALILLGRFYRSRDALEKARKTLETAVATAPDAVSAHLELQRVYRTRRWLHQAFLKAQALHERYPEVARLTANYAKFCDLYGYREQARRLWTTAVRQDAADSDTRRALADADAAQDRIDEALAGYAGIQALVPLSHTIRMQRVDLLLRRQRYDEAIALCKESLAICPTDAGCHAKLGEVCQRMGRIDEAVQSWRTALRYKPDDQRLRDYVEFLQPERESPIFAKFDVGPEEAAKIVRTPKIDEAAYPKAGAVILLQHEVTELFEDGSNSTREHGICKVLNERGRRRFTKIPLRGENRKVLRAVVIKPDGSEVEATQISGEGIHFAQLQAGSVLEYRVVYHRRGTSWLSRHYTHVAPFQSTEPILRREWVLACPKGRNVRHVVRGDHVKLTQSEFHGQTVYAFRADSAPMVESEVVRPPTLDIIEQVRVSTIEDWDEIARWEWALMKDQFAADSAIRRRVESLTAGCKTRADRLRAIHNFVAQKIQYKVIHQSGIFGVKPQKAANVLANEWGECKGKGALLITMLAEAGIEACYATLRTRDDGQLIRELPANQCNHAIVYVPPSDDAGQGLWLDATAEYNGVDELPWADRGVTAMVWDRNGRMTFKPVPQAAPSDNYVRLVLEATLSQDGSAEARANWKANGQFAAGFRQQFRQVGRRRQQLEAVVTSLQPGGQLTDVAFSDLADRDGPADIRFDFRAARYAVRAGPKLILRPKRRFDLTRRYAPRTERHYDVWLPMPSTIEYVEVYRFKPTWAITSVPEPAKLDTPWMTYEVRYAAKPGRLEASKSLVLKVTVVPRSEYDRLRAFCIAADEHEQKTMTVEPK